LVEETEEEVSEEGEEAPAKEEEPEEIAAEEPTAVAEAVIPEKVVEAKAPVEAKVTPTECPECAKEHGLHIPLIDGKCQKCGYTA